MRRLLAFSALVLCALAPSAHAVDYRFAALGNVSGVASFGAPVLNNAGAAAFNVSFLDGSDAIVRATPGAWVVIANDAARFRRFGNPTINASGQVGFEASLRDVTGEGIFRGSGGPAIQIAGTRDAGDFDFVRTGSSINRHGLVAFSGERIVGPKFVDGVYVGDGGEVRAVYDTNGPFSDFNGNPALDDAGQVAFLANHRAGHSGLFLGDGGGFTTVADDDGLLVGSLAWSDPSLNERGDIAFSAGTNEDFGDNGSATGAGVFVWRDGTLHTVVQGGFDEFFSLGDPSLNNRGELAFLMEPQFGEQILVTGADPLADRVLGTGDLLFGREVVGLIFSREGLNDRGQLAFTAFFADGGSAVVLATPVPEPGAAGLLAAGLLLLVLARRR